MKPSNKITRGLRFPVSLFASPVESMLKCCVESPVFFFCCGILLLVPNLGCEAEQHAGQQETTSSTNHSDHHSDHSNHHSNDHAGHSEHTDDHSGNSDDHADLHSDETHHGDPLAVTQESDSILERAKRGTSSAGKWVRDKFSVASESTSTAANGSLQWANATFQSLKDQGLTTANNTSEWLSEDWNNMESWEYKIISSESMDDASLEKKLNELGESGWECFDVTGDRLMLKKQRESYLRRLPFKDLIRLAPLLNTGDGH